MTDPRPTPPERVPVEVVRWRAARDDEPWEESATLRRLGDALAAALKATAAERDDWRDTAAEAIRKRDEILRRQVALAAERDRAHATLREIAGRATSQAAYSIAEVARERLENP